mmetsp:Transcript_21354/g.30570  ORF Transcript_21354/g.30570 Transcript_21354/m.30570 type:complete len:92 (+) Transcript_21354:191-466(+)
MLRLVLRSNHPLVVDRHNHPFMEQHPILLCSNHLEDPPDSEQSESEETRLIVEMSVPSIVNTKTEDSISSYCNTNGVESKSQSHVMVRGTG